MNDDKAYYPAVEQFLEAIHGEAVDCIVMTALTEDVGVSIVMKYQAGPAELAMIAGLLQQKGLQELLDEEDEA